MTEKTMAFSFIPGKTRAAFPAIHHFAPKFPAICNRFGVFQDVQWVLGGGGGGSLSTLKPP